MSCGCLFMEQNALWIQIYYRGLHWKGTVFYQVNCTLFYIENNAEIFPVHYTWKVDEKGFKIVFMMNKLATIISFEITL